MSVNISGGEQSPEFRAGLEALLNDPSATKEQIAAYWAKGPPQAPTAAPPPPERGKNGIVDNAAAFVRGAADNATLGFAAEIAAAGDTPLSGGPTADTTQNTRDRTTHVRGKG